MDRKEYLKARIMEGMGKKSGTKPMSDKEKSLAALAHPKDKITHKDVLVGRGVLKKEEVMGEEYVIHKGKHEPGTKSSLGGQTLHGVSVKDVYTDKKEAQAHADAINKGRGYKTGDEKNSLYGGVLYQVSPRKGMKEEVEQVDIVESLEKPKTIKVTTKNGWNFDGLIKVTGSDYHIVKHPVTGKQYRVDKSGNSIEEEVEQVDEGNKENKAKKNTYVANIIKKKLSSQVLPSLKFGRRELKKEEVEQVNEIDRSQPAAGRDSDRPYPTKPIKLTDKQRTSAKLMTRELLKHAKKQLKKEEVEQVGEAPYMGKGNHKPGWMLRADPELARKFKEIEDRKKNMNSLMKKYGGKTGDEIAKMKKEEASPMIKPPSNRFDNKKDAFAHAKKNGGKVYRHEYVNPRSGMKSTTFSVKEEAELDEAQLAHKVMYAMKDPKKGGKIAVAHYEKEKDAKKFLDDIKKKGGHGVIRKNEPKNEEVEQVDEASYSAKSARAGEDIGKPGKMFAKIAASAAKKYGSEERGKKVAGAVLKKLRAKQAK